jgi:phosphoglycolate phosphatase-like HAD superfamily hydrolase
LNYTLEHFQPQHDHLICVDSDGCGMDTMTIKHERAFGPALLDIWNLDDIKDDVLNRWNQFNLYEITRGINRFQGLEKILTELHQQGRTVDGYDDIKAWVDTTTTFSNPQLQQDIEANPDKKGLRLALDWSNRVNQLIQRLPSIGPFEYVYDALKRAYHNADIVIVSSANLSAVETEWTEHQLTPFITSIFAQEAGTKKHCINQLKRLYDANQVLVLGDAKGDMQAAQDNDVLFYPILAGNEATSWLEFKDKYLNLFINNQFDNTIQEHVIQQFYNNFD